ncbi:Nuclear prelamin A recognition factor [Myotis davidii]|uniref:Nuclear prelamin A recognition factor n=1 Tax=Myotis davidii TaxID=225400 RepID=L5LL26_MYODS|nr:Nuclear prelamin A recognition factor [Myotis davidii]
MLTSAYPGWVTPSPPPLHSQVSPADHGLSGEIVQIMEQSDLASNNAAVDTLLGDMREEEVRLHEGASSDGHLAHIFRHMAKELLNEDVGCSPTTP